MSKINSLKKIAVTEDIDIFFLSETWFTDRIPDITDFFWINKNRNDGKKGGGVAFLIKNDLKNLVSVIESGDEFEWLQIKLSMNNFVVDLIGVYSPQESEQRLVVEGFFDAISANIARHSSSEGFFIVMGDFNAKIKCSRNGKILNNFVKANKLTQMCSDEPTCRNSKVDSSSKIDYIFSSSNMVCVNVRTINDELMTPHYINLEQQLIFCDHKPIMFQIPHKTKRTAIPNKGKGIGRTAFKKLRN